jgi:DNA-binding LytR/AlgR family response regulator
MINCIIVDDEPLARQLLESYISQLPELTCVGICSGALEAFTILHNQQVDVMFLDIQMPGITGINFLKSLKDPPKIIFTTAFPDHAVEAFELEATDYLLKPITPERFIRAIQKIIPKTESAGSVLMNPAENPYIFLKVNKRLVKIDHKEIRYAESLGDYLKVHTSSQIYITYITMSKLEILLPENKFARIHRSTIVNLDCVKYIEGNFVHLPEKDLAIGLTYKENLSRKLNQPE